MRIATWNINGIKARHDQLLKWLELRKYPEVICLQEIKSVNELFPAEQYEKLGYKVYLNGQKSYNGVAVLVKSEISNLKIDISSNSILNKEARLLHLKVNEVNIINVYVPNGQAPQTEKYVWKFEFLRSLIEYLKSLELGKTKLILLGDLNIAPQAIDVHDPIKYANSIMFTQAERKIFEDILSLGLTDVFRNKHPELREYTWFDYLSNALIGNRGWRIDFILASKPVFDEIDDIKIDFEPRGWDRPSDHCPVVMKIKKSA